MPIFGQAEGEGGEKDAEVVGGRASAGRFSFSQRSPSSLNFRKRQEPEYFPEPLSFAPASAGPRKNFFAEKKNEGSATRPLRRFTEVRRALVSPITTETNT